MIETQWQQLLAEKEAYTRRQNQDKFNATRDALLFGNKPPPGTSSSGSMAPVLEKKVVVQETDVMGTVKTYNAQKSFGFLICDTVQRDVFVYQRHIIDKERLLTGQKVMFDLVHDETLGEGRPQARNVRVLDAEDDSSMVPPAPGNDQ